MLGEGNQAKQFVFVYYVQAYFKSTEMYYMLSCGYEWEVMVYLST